MLRKITYAGAHSTTSYQEAQNNLKSLAEFFISTSHIQRLTTKIAKEFDQKYYSSSNLLEDLPEPEDHGPIDAASISVDGGRAQIRQENSGPGVHNPRWIEPKAGCLQILESKEQDSDPHPILPKIFQDKRAVKHMVERLKGKTNQQDSADEDKKTKTDSHINTEQQLKKNNSYRPKVLKRFVIADIAKAESFGHGLYRKMYQHNLHSASRKAYICDGDPKLWTTIYEENFRADSWTPILDFIHAVEYAYEGAKLSAQTGQKCWAKYIDYVTHIWQGKPLTVIRRLDKTISELENYKKPKSKYLNDKIDKLKTIRRYFQNNFAKMNYPEYRKKGLPISSCHVESLIKQFNIRIKSSEKFWNRSSVKGIIKIKASLISDDNSWVEFWDNRFDRQAKSKMIYKPAELEKAA